MKKIILFFVLIFCFVDVTAAENSFIGNNDGITSAISADKLKGLEDWLYNLKLDINRDITQIEKAEVGDKEKTLYAAVERALKSAGSGTEEFLTRNILIRAIEVYNEILAKDMGSDIEPKRSAFARRFLELHLRWAGDLAPLDKQLLETLKDPYKISETEQRVEIGMEWAQKMVALSFSSPSNEAHYNFLLKAMGYLFNDIVNDDRYNRKLASTARVFLEKYREQEGKQITTQLEYLEEAKDFREFLLDEFNILNSVNLTSLIVKVSEGGQEKIANTQNNASVNVDGSLFFKTHKEILYYVCTTGYHSISTKRATEVATLVSNGQVDLNAFKSTYYRTCDYDESLKVGKLEKQSPHNFFKTHKEILYYVCTTGYHSISTKRATEVATLVSSGHMDLNAFKTTYYRTCDYDESLNVGKLAKTRK